MVVISISISESSEQLVAGFPKSIALSANLPSTIFYTLDGSEPSNLSLVYVDPIILPTDSLNFNIKFFATNGVDVSPIITKEYSTNILNNTRLPHAGSSNFDNSQVSMYPYGSPESIPNFDYINNSNSGITVNDSISTIIPYGYDADGNTIGANKPIDEYLNIYSTTNYQNKIGNGIGNMPGHVTVIGRRSPSEYSVESSNRSSGLFNPKARVIFQDATNDDPSNPVQINPQYFSMENLEIVKDGAPLRAVGLESAGITGSFLRSHYNPRTQMITSYYRDSSTNKWIISTYPYEGASETDNLSYMVMGKNDQGVGRVYTWNLFRYRVLT